MAKSNTKHRVCSGGSSVSSLLAHCSLSGGVFSNPDGSFRFKDKLYSSASEALQAYIDDFDLSRIHPAPSASKITKGPVNVPRFSSYMHKPNNAFENLDHRQHSHSLCYRRGTVNDMDSISLTTDDLLRLPADGSFSFTHVRPGHPPTKRMKKKYFRRLDSLDVKKNSNFHISSTPMSKDNLVTHDVYTIINGKKRGWPRIPEPMNRNNKCALSILKESSFKDSSEHSPDKNYPRWLTSQKSDLNVSGVTSIPDFKYPIWLHNKDLLPDTDSQRVYKLCKEDEFSPIYSYQTQRTQLINKVDCFENTFEPSNFTDSFSGGKGLVNEYKCDSEPIQCECENPLLPGKSQKPFNGDKIELLILKAKENLKPQCTEDLPKPVTKDDSPCSLDKLEAERSWENVPVTFKSPVPVNADDSPQQSSGETCVKEVLEDFLNNDNQSSTLSGGKHHGPVEALKQMLFNLQAVQESFNQNKTTETKEEINQVLEDDFSKLQLKENMIPITTSLQKALQHLSHLRDLVDDTSGKQSPKM